MNDTSTGGEGRPALSRRDREQLRHRQEILLAAEQIFADKGYHSTTMEEIAQKSEFAIGSLYKHFRSKDAIFRTLLEEHFGRYTVALERMAQREGPFWALFDEFLTGHVEFANRNAAFFRLFYTCQVSSDYQREDLRSMVSPFMQRYHQCLEQLLAKGVAEGQIRDVPVEDLSSFVMGTLHGFFFRMLHSSEVFDLTAKLPVIRSLLLSGAGTPAAIARSGV